MYNDYPSTDTSHSTSFEHDRERQAAGTPPTSTTPSSYPPRTSSFNNTRDQPNHAAYSPSLKSQSLGPQSPKDPAAMRSATPPHSVSPFSASPRPSEDIPLSAPQQQHAPHYPLQRRLSGAASVVSEKITTQYAPTIELGPTQDDGQTGFDEGVLRALCELDVRTSFVFKHSSARHTDASSGSAVFHCCSTGSSKGWSRVA